jgi:hypothetical protein
MRPRNHRVRLVAVLTLALLGSSVAVIPPAQAGPIADMMARHRQAKQMKLPPMEKPFSKKPVKDLSVQNTSFATRLKKRFSIKRDGASGMAPIVDSSVTKASR